jgi:hypothetical protein
MMDRHRTALARRVPAVAGHRTSGTARRRLVANSRAAEIVTMMTTTMTAPAAAIVTAVKSDRREE